MLYKDACAHFLEVVGRDAFDEDEEIAQAFRDQSIILIQEYEELITCTMSLQTTRSADAQMLQDEILKMQRASFYAKYGEIFVPVCRRLGNESEACKFASWKASGNGYWADVNCKLQDKNEKAAYALVLKGGSERGSAIGKCPTHKAIWQSCIRFGLQTKEILATIQHYASLEELPHTNLLPLIKPGGYQDLMRELNDGFCNIPLIVPVEEVFQTSLMVIILEAMINLWFCRDKAQPDDIQKWIPSKELRRRHWELNEPHPRRIGVGIYQEMSDAIILSIWKRCHDQQKKQEIISMRQNDFGLATEERKRKRTASYQVGVETFRAKQRKANFYRLIRLASYRSCRRMSDVYAESCGHSITCIVCGSHRYAHQET